MKPFRLFLLISFLLGGLTGWTQDREPPRERGPGNGPQGERGPRNGPQGERKRETPPPVVRYLEMLKTQDPDEHQRLKTLQNEDPIAFRRELRQRVITRRREHHGPQEQRGAYRENMQNIREAETPEARAQAIEELRASVEQRVEANLKQREERIQQVREQLILLEKRHAEERAEIDQLVDRHVEKLLEKLEQERPPAKD